MNKLDYYRNRALAYLDYVRKTQGEGFGMDMLLDIINTTYEKGDLKGMREIDQETTNEINHYPKEERMRINKALEAVVGIDAEEEERKRAKMLKAILKRGHIKNDQEYELAHSHLDQLLSEDKAENAKEIEAFDRMVVDYSMGL